MGDERDMSIDMSTPFGCIFNAVTHPDKTPTRVGGNLQRVIEGWKKDLHEDD